MHILFTCIYRVRLVERGSPHSLPLMESGKVSTERTFILTFYGEYFQYISISDNFYISWVLKEALSAVQTEATEALAAHTLPVMLRMLISSVLTAALPTLVGRGRSFCHLTSAHLCLVVCPITWSHWQALVLGRLQRASAFPLVQAKVSWGSRVCFMGAFNLLVYTLNLLVYTLLPFGRISVS